MISTTSPSRLCSALVLVIAVCLAASVTGPASAGGATESRPTATVVWISIDGLRWDYPSRTETPILDRLAREGAFTRALAPAFPTLTFPTHVSLVTGVPAGTHGIASNGYFDRELGEQLRYPAPSRLLQSEPIWITAERQGIRTAVFDWPVSHQQEGEITASYFGMRYDPRIPDEPRLLRSIEAWENDEHETPLRLLMSYAVATDRPGHRYGPDAPEMIEHIQETDALIGRFLDEVLRVAKQKLPEGEELYIVITTDHGMSRVDYAVNPDFLLGLDSDSPDSESEVRVVTSGNVANIYLSAIEPEAERQRIADELIASANRQPFATAARVEDLPARFGYQNPRTIGDVVVILDRGYTFSSRPTQLLATAESIGGPLGMHGYDVETNPEMYGYSVIWRYPTPLGGIDLGRVDYRSIHPTIAAILGIEPAPNATGQPLPIVERALQGAGR